MSHPVASRAWGRGIRIAVGAVLAVGVTVGLVAAVGAPLPTVTRDPVVVEARPGAADSTVACAGPILAAGRNRAAAAEVEAAAPTATTVGAAAGREAVDPREVALTAAALAGAEVPAFVASPVDGVRTDVAAAQSGRVDAEDLTGFAAAACTAPSFESWVVGGSAATGELGLLVLSNPAPVAASVDITVFGPDGPSVAPGGSGVTVGASQQVLVPLAGIADGDAAPVLRVQSSGAPIAAALQVSATATLVPLGVDVAGPAAAPSDIQLIPGVIVPDTENPDVPPTALVRLLAPTASGVATVTAVDQDGREVASSGEVDLASGVPLEVTLADLPVGAITVRVDSDIPVVAGALSRRTADGVDLAWFASAEEVQGVTVFAVAPGPRSTLSVVSADGESSEAAVIRISDGETIATISVPARGAVRVSVPAGEVYALDAPGPVHAAVAFSAPGTISGYPLAPAAETAAAVTVIP